MRPSRPPGLAAAAPLLAGRLSSPGVLTLQSVHCKNSALCSTYTLHSAVSAPKDARAAACVRTQAPGPALQCAAQPGEITAGNDKGHEMGLWGAGPG